MRHIFLITVGTLAFFLAGCGKAPLEKLASNTEYPDMTYPYWKNIKNTDPVLWGKALDYCQKNFYLARPNCNPVNMVSVAGGIGSTKLVPLNSNPIQQPNFSK